MERSLRNMPYAQAKVYIDKKDGRDLVVLRSYATNVIIVYKGELTCSGLYSMTTRKHISAFLSEYYPHISFYDVKAIAGTEKSIRV